MAMKPTKKKRGKNDNTDDNEGNGAEKKKQILVEQIQATQVILKKCVGNRANFRKRQRHKRRIKELRRSLKRLHQTENWTTPCSKQSKDTLGEAAKEELELQPQTTSTASKKKLRKKKTKKVKKSAAKLARERLHVNLSNLCKRCGSKRMQIPNESRFVCKNNCAVTQACFSSGGPSSYKDEADLKRHLYERKKNFKKRLKLHLDTEPEIEIECYVDIQRVRRRNLVQCGNIVLPADIAKILALKSMERWRHHDKYVVKIACRLNGEMYPIFTQVQFDHFMWIYKQLQPAYQELREMIRNNPNHPMAIKCPQTNFFHFNLCMNKICQMCGNLIIAAFFPLIKERRILRQREYAWKWCVEFIGLPYYCAY